MSYYNQRVNAGIISMTRQIILSSGNDGDNLDKFNSLVESYEKCSDDMIKGSELISEIKDLGEGVKELNSLPNVPYVSIATGEGFQVMMQPVYSSSPFGKLKKVEIIDDFGNCRVIDCNVINDSVEYGEDLTYAETLVADMSEEDFQRRLAHKSKRQNK